MVVCITFTLYFTHVENDTFALILSIPIGVALSISLGSTKRRILIFHITSVVFWTLLIFGIYYGLGFDLTEMFK